MKKLCLILCVIILSVSLFACKDNENEGDFSHSQKDFYNDTVNNLNGFLNLSDETLDFSYDINENFRLFLRISKNDDMLFSRIFSQGVLLQQEGEGFYDECKYELDFSVRKLSANTDDDRIGFTLYCFQDEESAKAAYNWMVANNVLYPNIFLDKNKIVWAYGNLSYNKTQIIDSINDLKENWQNYKSSLSGGNFSRRQREFYNDTISRVNYFLSDEIFDLAHDINEDLRLNLYTNKIDGIYLTFSSLMSQGTATQEDVNEFSANCMYRLELGVAKISAETNDDSIGFTVFCFKDNKTAEDFYQWTPAKYLFFGTMTLDGNKVLYAYGDLDYNKNQIISSLDYLIENNQNR